MSVTNEDSNESQQRKAPDARQSEASLYKLYSKDPENNDIYIGCTKRLLRHMAKHYYVCHTSNTPRREHGGWNDWTNEILDKATLTTMEQRKLKRHYIETLKSNSEYLSTD